MNRLSDLGTKAIVYFSENTFCFVGLVDAFSLPAYNGKTALTERNFFL